MHGANGSYVCAPTESGEGHQLVQAKFTDKSQAKPTRKQPPAEPPVQVSSRAERPSNFRPAHFETC